MWDGIFSNFIYGENKGLGSLLYNDTKVQHLERLSFLTIYFFQKYLHIHVHMRKTYKIRTNNNTRHE